MEFDPQLMLPNAQHAPAESTQHAIDESIARAIAGDLRTPIGPVLHGQPDKPWMSVPEIAIDEHRQLIFFENKVGSAEKRAFATPADEMMPAKQMSEHQLRAAVASAPDPRH